MIWKKNIKSTICLFKGKEYLYKQDWGEQLVSKKQSVIGMYDLRDDSVHVLDGVPENVCPAQVIWAADGKHLFGIALKTEPRKLGLIYCSNRSSTIFSLDLQENYGNCIILPCLLPFNDNILVSF